MDSDYDDLLRSLNAPPVTVWLPVREWVVAHEPPEPYARLDLFPRDLLKALPPANRLRLVELAFAMLADAGVADGEHPGRPEDPVDVDRQAQTIGDCADTFSAAMRDRFPFGSATAPGRLYPPPPWPLHNLDERGRFYEWPDYFVDAWLRAARYHVPVRLPEIRPPEFDGLLAELPVYTRDRWRSAILDHLGADARSRPPALIEVASVAMDEWQRRTDVQADDVANLANALRRLGFTPFATAADRLAARDL